MSRFSLTARYLYFLYLAIAPTLSSANPQDSEYPAVISAFSQLRNSSVFPVSGKTLDDVESTFGPRIQSSSNRYDFHRGIDVDGVQGDSITAAMDGVFFQYRVFSGGGNTVILRHEFPEPVRFCGEDYPYYYTYYFHLWDDETPDNQTSTDDIISGWEEGITLITAGQEIGKMGDSGTPPNGGSYADHLHFEIRLGTRTSLEYQLDNIGSTTQYGFDPHLHPYFLFPPKPYQQSLVPLPSITDDRVFQYIASDDDMPILNRIEIDLKNSSGETIASHLMDFNLRIGYDASSTENLDSRDLDLPYIEPQEFGTSPSAYGTKLIIPQTWVAQFPSFESYTIRAFDIWNQQITYNSLQPFVSPTITNYSYNPVESSLTWDATPLTQYEVFFSDNLITWDPLPDSTTTSEKFEIELSHSFPTPPQTRRFYRVVQSVESE